MVDVVHAQHPGAVFATDFEEPVTEHDDLRPNSDSVHISVQRI